RQVRRTGGEHPAEKGPGERHDPEPGRVMRFDVDGGGTFLLPLPGAGLRRLFGHATSSWRPQSERACILSDSNGPVKRRGATKDQGVPPAKPQAAEGEALLGVSRAGRSEALLAAGAPAG